MPRTAERALTPHRPTKSWKKFYRGRLYYVGRNLGAPWGHKNYRGVTTSCPFYRAALAEWHVLLEYLQAQERQGVDINDPRFQHHLKKWRRLPEGQRNTMNLAPVVPPFETSAQAVMRFAYVPVPATTPTAPVVVTLDTALAGLVDAYLVDRLAKVQGGQFSIDHYGESRDKLTYFKQYAEHRDLKSVQQIDAATLQHFHNEQLYWLAQPKRAGGVTATTVRKRLVCVRDFLAWCERMGAVSTMPAFLSTDFCKVVAPRNGNGSVEHNGKDADGENLVYDADEIQELFALAPERTKLYILLGLNAGFTQTDISTLRWDHYETATGIIDRLRNKTKHKTPMRQVFQLWPETQKLLRKFSARGRGLMLMGEGGNELVSRKIDANGKPTKTDSIALAFERLLRAKHKARVLADMVADEKRRGVPKGQSVIELLRSKSRDQGDKRKRENARKEIDRKINHWLKQDRRRFKHLRKSAANELEHHADYKPLVELFLAHSERGQKKSYVNADYKALEPAVAHLRDVYNLTA